MTEKLKKELDLDLLEELESQKQSHTERMRIHERVSIRSKVVLQPANTVEALRTRVQGLTCDLSTGGCRAVFPVGIMVGDVFRLQIELESQELPIVFARCLRCRMINDTAFEAAFTFFSRIEIDEDRYRRPTESSDPLDLL